ncbi:T6SS immunity protein Tli4 family protein [Pseudoxanthomonas kalamensis]|uniref:T6SS immunity protein Tli4 family protein n=1 Tax=Pseudoxanthomonas kalamensis TaxID=289483 RepID=UPI001391CDC5|nr:T6SS immunity protein Tli4 family protein [Pseudoxanthomonas kalamensis]
MRSKLLVFQKWFFIASLCVFVSGCGHAKVNPMDTTGWKTHCFGRFLVDLPPKARVSQMYKIWSNEFKRTSIDFKSLDGKISSIEDDLKSASHKGSGSMYIKTIGYDNGSTGVLRWDSARSSEFMWMSTYFVAPPKGFVYQMESLVEIDKQHSSQSFAEKISSNISSLEMDVIPSGSGYCIDGAFIAGDDLQSESFNIGVTLPKHPGMNITLFVTTQGEVDKETLLDRAGAVEAAVLLQGGKLLRKGKRNTGDHGSIPGGEYLMTSEEDGQKIYGFTWEALGKANSIAAPYMTVELQVLGQSVVDEEHPYQPPFKDDDEAVALWDAIIESIRLRPGAASI